MNLSEDTAVTAEEDNAQFLPVQHFNTILAEFLDNQSEDIATNVAMFGLAQDNESVIRQLGVLQSESHELVVAIQDADSKEFYDGIGDCLFVVGSIRQLNPTMWMHYHAVREAMFLVNLALLGIAHHRNWQDILVKCIGTAMIGNLTKYDLTEADAQKTVDAYAAKGIVTHIRKLADGKYLTVATNTDPANDVVAGKVLKSITRYTEPNFEAIADDYDVRFSAMFNS